jgi:hypothetical protein
MSEGEPRQLAATVARAEKDPGIGDGCLAFERDRGVERISAAALSRTAAGGRVSREPRTPRSAQDIAKRGPRIRVTGPATGSQ